MKPYYDWPEKMKTQTDSQLRVMVRNRDQISEEEYLAAEEEMIKRGLINPNERIKIKRVDPEICYLVAKLSRQGKSNDEILKVLNEKGLNNELSKIILDEFLNIKNRAFKSLILGLIVCPIVIITLFYFTSYIVWGPGGLLIMWPIRAFRATLPNVFKKYDKKKTCL